MVLPDRAGGAGKSSGCREDDFMVASMPYRLAIRKFKKRTGFGPQ